MPMSLEAIVIYLGAILAGCVACTVADSFAPREIAARLRIAACRLVFTQARGGPGAARPLPSHRRPVVPLPAHSMVYLRRLACL